MAFDIQRFSALFPIGTSAAAPTIVAMTMPARIVRVVVINVPPGPRGELNIALAANGVQYFPSNAGAFVTPDNDKIVWPLDNVIESGAWQMIGYNTGNFPHQVEVLFYCDLPGPGPTAPAPIVPSTGTVGSTVGLEAA